MKAKDIVMNRKQLAKVWLEREQGEGFLIKATVEEVLADNNLFDEIDEGHSKAIAQAQAEISFKAGYKEGRRDTNEQENLEAGHKVGIGEVVECVENLFIGGTENFIAIDGRKWQAQKKIWGIE